MPESARITVIGAGSWGTALACHLTRNGHCVSLWGRNRAQLLNMARERVNARYLPGMPLPASLNCETQLAPCITRCDALLIATPSHAFRDTLQMIATEKYPLLPLIWACKGLEPGTAQPLDLLAREILGESLSSAVISGPSFAKELMQGLPTAISVAAQDSAFAERVATWLHSDTFRAYYSSDVIGVEIAGAWKTVFAIAAGIADGLDFGANARAALITRGLAELMRLGVAMGGQRETFMGLAGMGDLVLTCTDNLSRNRRMGLALARGLSVEAALAEIAQAVEGVGTTREAMRLSRRYAIEMPITEQIYAVLYEQKPPQQAVRDLLAREPRAEI